MMAFLPAGPMTMTWSQACPKDRQKDNKKT
jgi:hypothetical protein